MRRDDEMLILTRLWVHALVVAIVAVVAFGPALEGKPVWDDTATIGTAALLKSPFDAFSTELMSAGGSPTAYLRPAVTISLWAELKVFSEAPTVGMHISNLLWHALAGVLVLMALRRWTRADDARTYAACLLGAVMWTVLPQKAENVAWISGRGDVMGLVFLLGALALRERAKTVGARVAIVTAGSALALACKESFVIAPVVVALELHAARGPDAPPINVRRPPPELVGSVVLVAVYLAVRGLGRPIQGGGAGMYAGLGVVDRASLFAETVGYAFRCLVTPWKSELLRGPVAFAGPAALVRDPRMAIVGVVGTAVVIAVAVRVRAVRPSAALLLTLLPISNLVPTGLESRMNDRFLYVPSLALALLLTVVSIGALRDLPERDPSKKRLGAVLALGVVVGSIVLLVQARERSWLFTTNDRLFSWERQHGDRATSVLVNAGTAAADAGRYREARDLRLQTVDRYRELGFGGEGFAELVDAVRFQVFATGEEHLASMAALFELMTALDEGADTVVEVPFDDGTAIGLPTGTPTARQYAASKSASIKSQIAWLRAKVGDPASLEQARGAAESCPRCAGVLRTCAEVALMTLSPGQASDWLATARESGAEVEPLVAATDLEKKLVDKGDPRSLVAARFLGGTFGKACRDGVKLDLRNDPYKVVVLVACSLAADTVRVEALGGWPTEDLAKLAPTLRNDWAGRGELITGASSE